MFFFALSQVVVVQGGAVSAAMQPQKIMFIDDVAFCAKDAIRLLSHSVDIACGLDFAHYEVGPHHIRSNSSSH